MDSIQEKDKISYLKGTYIWKTSNDEIYNYRMKIIKSINNNIKLPIMNIYKDKEYILKPRCIVNDPFSNENSLLIWSDIIDLEGNCHSNDSRISFLQEMKDYNDIIKKNIPRISFIQRYHIEEKNIFNSENILDEFIKLCLGCNIEVDEFKLDNNILEIQNIPTQILSACDELLITKFLFYKLSLKYNFKYKLDDQIRYTFDDINTLSDNGHETIVNYVKKLENIHSNIQKSKIYKEYQDKKFTFGNELNNMIIIPESVKKFNNGFFIDQRFDSSSGPYSIIYNIIKLIYTPMDTSSKNVKDVNL
jgi:hypothetical protein